MWTIFLLSTTDILEEKVKDNIFREDEIQKVHFILRDLDDIFGLTIRWQLYLGIKVH